MIHSGWDDPHKQVLIFTYSDDWTWNDVKVGMKTYQKIVYTSPHVVNAISLFPSQYRIPDGGILPTLIEAAKILHHPYCGQHIVVNTQMLLNIFIEVVCRTDPVVARQVKVVKTLDAARKLLQDERVG